MGIDWLGRKALTQAIQPRLLLGAEAAVWLAKNGPFYTKDELIELDVRRERARMLSREEHLIPPQSRQG